MDGLKAKLIILCYIILAIATANASARIEGRWALQVGDIITGEDISIQKPQATLFHQQASSMADLEDLDISFPLFVDGLQSGPVSAAGGAVVDGVALGAGAESNILPFGPVNLAIPSIHEDVRQSVDTSSTGFATANWAYIADTAAGNLGSEPLGTHLASGHPLKSPKMLGSEFLWPLMTPLPKASASAGSMAFDMGGLAGDTPLDHILGSILDHVPVYHTPRVSFYTGGNATGASNNTTIQTNNTAVMNQTSQNNNSRKPGTPTRKPRINPAAKKEEIKNMTTMQRVYRNAFVGSTMHKAYEGPTQYPTAIDPYDDGKGVFNQIDMQKILQVSLKKTRPGEHIAPVLWDI